VDSVIVVSARVSPNAFDSFSSTSTRLAARRQVAAARRRRRGRRKKRRKRRGGWLKGDEHSRNPPSFIPNRNPGDSVPY